MTVWTIPDRVWNTWDYRYPGCVVHAASGFAVRVCAYSGKEDHYTDFDVNEHPDLALGAHTQDGSYIALEMRHAGTRLHVEFAKHEWHEIVGQIRILEQGELLFRNHLILEAGFLWPSTQAASTLGSKSPSIHLPPVDEEHAYLTPSCAHALWRSQVFCLAVAPQPVVVATYPESSAAGKANGEDGWPAESATAPGDRWLAFRFTGDRRQPVTFALAQATDLGTGRRSAGQLLGQVHDILAVHRENSGHGHPAVTAVRDVMAWNTVADPVNSRSYTCLTRSWVQGLGGWTIWLTDVLYNALLNARAGDWDMAKANLEAVLAGQQPAGNLACLMAGSQEWVDRTQLPIASYITWRVYLLLRDRALLERSYPILRRHHDWWFAQRDGNKNGLLEYGSSPTGRAPYAHTKQGAVNESGMDNMAIFDDAEFDPVAHTLRYEEVASNSLLVLEGQMLARIAAELGDTDSALRWQSRANTLTQLVRDTLWDPQRQLFVGRFWSGTFAPEISPTSFFPLVAGIPTPEQAEALVNGHLLNEAEFWSELPLPSAPFNDPIAAENDYWRGRIWPPLNYFTWEGLRRYGYDDLAAELAERSWRMFMREWESKRHCHENYHIKDPELNESPDSDPFYSWGALMPLMTALESADFSPWDGLTLTAKAGTNASLTRPGCQIVARLDGQAVTLSVNNTDRLQIMPSARLRHVVADDDRIRVVLPATTEGYEVRLPGIPKEAEPPYCQVSGRPVNATSTDGGLQFHAAASDRPIEIAFGQQAWSAGGAAVAKWQSS